MDIDLLKVPCDIIGMQFVSSYGKSHQVEKLAIDKNGDVQTYVPSTSMDEMTAKFKAKEGCKLRGTIYPHFIQSTIKIVPSFPSPEVYILFSSDRKHFKLDLSHRINHLSFGTAGLCETRMSYMGLSTKSCTQLQNFTQMETYEDKNEIIYYRHAYNLQVTPCTSSAAGFLSSIFSPFFYQYTASHFSKKSQESDIIIDFDVMSFTVAYKLNQGDIMQLLVAIISGIGGLYMIFLTVHSFIMMFTPSSDYDQIPVEENKKEGLEVEVSQLKIENHAEKEAI